MAHEGTKSTKKQIRRKKQHAFFVAFRQSMNSFLFSIAQRLTQRYTASGQVSATLQKIYLENLVLGITIISIILLAMMQSYQNFISLRLFYIPIPCVKGRKCLRFHVDYRYRPLDTSNVITGLDNIIDSAHIIIPHGSDVELAMENQVKTITHLWYNYAAILPLDPMCCILILMLDIGRRVLRRYFKRRDISCMFCIFLLLFVLGILRITQLHIYLLVQFEMKKFVGYMNIGIQNLSHIREAPLVACIEPPRAYFLTIITSLFFITMQMTLIMDYLDPT